MKTMNLYSLKGFKVGGNVHALGDVANTDAILDFVTSHDIDIVALTETWLKGDPSDA